MIYLQVHHRREIEGSLDKTFKNWWKVTPFCIKFHHPEMLILLRCFCLALMERCSYIQLKEQCQMENVPFQNNYIRKMLFPTKTTKNIMVLTFC